MFSCRTVRFFKQAAKNFSTEYIIKSKGKHLEIPKLPLYEYVWKDLHKWPNKTAIVCFESQRSYTYHQLYQRSLSITRFLTESLKYKNRETVGIVLPNTPEYPIVLLGALQAGLRVTPYNPNYTSDELKKQLQDSHTQLVFTSSELLPVVRQATDALIVEVGNNKNVTRGAISFEEISTGESTDLQHNINVNDIILLPYSSGTTGLPKGVQLSHFNTVANLSQISSPEFRLIERTEGNDQDTIPAFLPFFHIYGLVCVMLKSLSLGAKLIAMPKFSSENFVTLLKNYRSDVIYGVPLVVVMANKNPLIKKEDLVGLRYLMSGAAPLGASDVERFREKTDDMVCIIQGYGMTETSPVTVMQTTKLEHGVKIGGSGLLVPNTEAKIISLDTDSKSLGPGQTGELVIKGPQVMLGYYNNPKADEDIFIEKDWLRTGDIAYFDEHDHFFVVDRCKELIKVKGFQVAPAEIEEILRSHPSVEDAGVIGIPHSALGETPKAFVVVKAGESVTPLDLQEYVAAKTAKHKHLSGGVTFVQSIPKSASGKILRRQLRDL